MTTKLMDILRPAKGQAWLVLKRFGEIENYSVIDAIDTYRATFRLISVKA